MNSKSTKRSLFHELKDGLESLRDARLGKIRLRKASPFSPGDLEAIREHLAAITAVVPLRVIENEEQYDHAVAVLNGLLDAGGSDQNGPLAPLVVALGDYIGDYEDKHPWEPS